MIDAWARWGAYATAFSTGLVNADNTHPTAAGYADIAEAIFEVIGGVGGVSSSDLSGLGTMAFQNANNVSITGAAQITGLPAPSNASDAATKTYVDTQLANSIAGLSLRDSVESAFTAALPANTYSNGASGVGATLTGNSNGALSNGSYTPSVGDRVAVIAESTASHNGIYTVTQVGDASHHYILTRAADANSAGNILPGIFTFIENTSDANVGSQIILITQGSITVGTTSLTFTLVNNRGTVTSMAVSGANGIGVSGSPVTTSGTISLSLGAITPASVAASGSVTGSNLSGTNTGDQTTSNSDGTLTVTNGSANPVVSLALGHANTWTAAQTFTPASSSSTPFLSGAVASQSVDIAQWSNNTPAVRARITKDANFSNTGGQTGSEIFGDAATVGSGSSLAFGNSASAAGASAVAIGASASASTSNTTAVGKSASATAAAGTAIGQGASCASSSGAAFGSSASTGSANNTVAIGASSSVGASSAGGIALGASATVGASHAGSIAIGHNAMVTAAGQFVVSSTDNSITDVYFGNGVTNASPAAYILHGVGGSGSNIAGGNITLAGGIGTGTGAGGSVIVQVAAAGTTGSTANTLATAVTVAQDKSATFAGKVVTQAGIYQSAGAAEEAVFDNGNSGTSKTIVWDNGNLQKVTITGACTFTFTAPANPGKFTLMILQDATGHAITLPTIIYPGGTAPTWSSAANKKDLLSVMYDGSAYWGIGNVAFA